MVHWNALTEQADHRPWPLPAKRWVMTMSWLDLLFAHWQIEPAELRARIPEGLELDTYDGRAYLGVVPFRMEKVGPRGLGWLPGRLPGPRSFPELNVRTYVKRGGKAGVWFFSLDAADALAVAGARAGFHLPYFRAEITLREIGGWIEYTSSRTDRRAGPGELRARYRPVGERLSVPTGGLEHWLTERYCLYARDRQGGVVRGDIHHQPWPLHQAEAEIEVNTVAEAFGIQLDTEPPLLHFARRLDVVGWWITET